MHPPTLVLTNKSQNRRGAKIDVPVVVVVETGFEQMKNVDLGKTRSLDVITATMMMTMTFLTVTARHIEEGGRRRKRKRKRKKKNDARNEGIVITANEEKEGDPVLPRHRRRLTRTVYRSRRIPRHRRPRIEEGKRKGGETKNGKDKIMIEMEMEIAMAMVMA